MPRKANLFLCSAPRSGSTQLAAWLDTHPAITLSPIKEPNFFSAQDFDAQHVRDTHLNDVEPEAYVASRSTKPYQFAIFREQAHYDYLFSGVGTPWALDASTSYLQSVDAPERIHAYNPDAVVVILTRHPVERAISHFRLAHRTGRTRLSLADQVALERNASQGGQGGEAGFLLRFSRYLEGIARFRAVFPQDQIVELRFEDLIADPVLALAPLGERLGIDPGALDFEHEKRNAGDAPRFPALNTWAMESGLKPLVGRLVGPAVKDQLKRILFKRGGGPTASAEERGALRDELADEVAAYEQRGPRPAVQHAAQ